VVFAGIDDVVVAFEVHALIIQGWFVEFKYSCAGYKGRLISPALKGGGLRLFLAKRAPGLVGIPA
jgi:hypothetical protein